LIEAMKIVWKWNKETRLILAGNCSPRPDDLDVLLERFSEAERARVLRIDNFPESDKVALYDAFDVFALPSTDESFGISYLEAWLCKKPVVGSRIGAVRCVIQDGVDGVLVEHRNAIDLGDKLVTLLSDPETCRQMGERGYQKTVESYTWPMVVEKAERLFVELKSRRRSSGSETPVAASQAV
jgi:glycosyltransferase involved in cell wall biosynthesis